MPQQFQTMDAALTAVGINYKNKEYVGNEVAPICKVPKKTFQYNKWDKGQVFTVPDTVLTKTGEYPEVEFTSNLVPGMVENRGIAMPVASEDIEEQAQSGNTTFLAALTEKLIDKMLLRKEVQIAKVAQDKKNYGSNVKTYVASKSWKNESVDPIADIVEARDNALVRFNRLWLAQDAFNALSKNKNVISYFAKSTEKALITAEMLSALLGLKVVVGLASCDTSLPGADPKLENAWRGKAGLCLYDVPAATSATQTFMFDAYWAPNGNIRDVSKVFKEDRGRMGVEKIFVAESSNVLVTSEDYGYLFEGVLA